MVHYCFQPYSYMAYYIVHYYSKHRKRDTSWWENKSYYISCIFFKWQHFKTGVYMYMYNFMYMYMYMCMCMYICMYICICIYMYISSYIWVYSPKQTQKNNKLKVNITEKNFQNWTFLTPPHPQPKWLSAWEVMPWSMSLTLNLWTK